MTGGEAEVEGVLVVHEFLDGKIFPDELLAGESETTAEFGVGGELEQTLRGGGGVADLH